VEFSFPAKSFKESFGIVSRVVPTRAVRPILQSVKVVAERDSLTLMASDNDISIRLRLETTCEVPGVGLLPKGHVESILRVTEGETLVFRSEGNKLSIRSAAGRWNVNTEDPATFPDVPEFGCDIYHTLSGSDYKRLVKRTAHAIDPVSVQYALGGMLYEGEPNLVRLAATDAKVIGAQECPATFSGEWPAPGGQRVIPHSTQNVLSALLPDGPVDIGFQGGTSVRFRGGGLTVHSRLLEGRFPPWRRAIPSDPPIRLPVPVGTFRRAVEQAAVFRSQESRSLFLSFSPGLVSIAASSIDVGDTEIEFPIEWPSEPLRIKLDSGMLLGTLRAFDDEMTVTFGFTDTITGLHIESADGFLGSIALMNQG
jgi:DNA polymerase-3 subunit beta